MKSIIKSICFIALCGTIVFYSCKKEGPAGPQGPEGPQGPAGSNTTAGTGKIIGTVKFYTENGDLVSVDPTAKVFIPGTTYSAVPNSSGSYTISNVPSGIYSLFATAVGYSSVNIVDLAVGNGITYSKVMGHIKTPTWTLLAESTATVAGTYSIGSVASTVSQNVRALRYFLSDVPVIDPLHPNTFKLISNAVIFGGQSGTTNSYPAQNLYNVGFSPGQIVYFKAYPCPGFFNTATIPSSMQFFFTDTISGDYVNAALNFNGVASASFVCPGP